MKKNTIIIGAVLFMIASCTKKLDILPEQDVAEETALTSDANVKKALNGAYDALSSGNLYGGNIQLYSELLAADGEIRWEGTFNQPREVWNKAILTTNSFVRDTWLSAYNTINIANNILSAIDVVAAADRDRIKGEALFIRGSMYFELVKLFAKPYSAGNISSNLGLPLVLTPTRGIDASSYVARSSVEQTYTQIVSDLTEAETLLPASNGIYARKIVAAAQLSRVYLQMENYPAARDAANRGIGYGGVSLTVPYAKAFNSARILASDPVGSLPETIFQIVVSSQDGANSMHLYWSITAYGAREGDVTILPKHLALYTPSDQRLALFYQGAGNTVGSGPYRSGKWKYIYSSLSVIRLAELYLTRAEANFREGTSVGATPLNDVNDIRGRAGLTPLGAVDLNSILLERKLELAHEGQGIADLKRLRLSADGFAYNADKLVLPIPQREIDASRNVIEQNTGY
ncbi:MAG TPA: RagB/SusD family nutrient uptake outer membrane protein [Chitinophagaceae bacterium]|nr:RagB/SusD family nutrient uptake outer membrane protein [Chitinophagaceae bacterium]